MMISRNQKNHAYQCRKKAIFGDRKIPEPGPYKLVWAINMQGSTFMPAGDHSLYKGDPQIKTLMTHKLLPQINKNIGQIWIRQQQNTLKPHIFPFIRMAIQILVLFLFLSLIVILLASSDESSLYCEILITWLYCIFLFCLIVTVYTWRKGYEKVEYDEGIVREIREILCQGNGIYFRDRGYVGKCDQWGIWICVGLDGKGKGMGMGDGSQSDSQYIR